MMFIGPLVPAELMIGQKERRTIRDGESGWGHSS